MKNDAHHGKKRSKRRLLGLTLFIAAGVLSKVKIQETTHINVATKKEKQVVEPEKAHQLSSTLAESKRLDVDLICQLPELYNGCEVTSLAMLLNYKGIMVSKQELADNMIKDDTDVVYDSEGEIITWGNPSVGFVGDVTGNSSIGFAINPEPLIPLVNKYSSGRALNLTGEGLDALKHSINNNNPVLVWISSSFTLPVEYTAWKDSKGNDVQGTFSTHTVLLTGYDEEYIYYNDPLSGYKEAAIDIETFEEVWEAMGSKALTVK